MSQEFQEIVELGTKILPLLVEKIDNNPEDFHLEIAIRRITKKHFAKSEWPSGKLGDARTAAIMYAQWRKEGRFKTEELFKELYDKYKSLKLEKKDKKAQEIYQQIVNLGIPVLPYLIDKLESHPEFVPAISKLSSGVLPLTATTADCRQWWETNSLLFSNRQESADTSDQE